MTQTPDDRARNVVRAGKHEQMVVNGSRDPAFHISGGRPIDAIMFRDNGIVDIVECKFTDDSELIVSKTDILKCVNIAKALNRNKHQSRVLVDVWFPKHKKRRKILVYDSINHDIRWGGESIRVWIANTKVMSKELREFKNPIRVN